MDQEYQKRKNNYEEKLQKSKTTGMTFTTVSGEDIKPLYEPDDIESIEEEAQAEKKRLTSLDTKLSKIVLQSQKPLTATLVVNELGLSLEESYLLLNRFIDMRQAKKFVDIDGIEYVVFPFAWKELTDIETTILNALLDANGRMNRVQLRVLTNVPENKLSEILNKLEKSGYILFDSIRNEYRIKT